MALSSGVPIDPSVTSRSAPASIRAAATSASSLLAAQWRGRLRARPSFAAVVRVGAGSDEQRDDRGRVGEETGPIGDDVQRRAGVEAVAEGPASSLRGRRKDPCHGVDVADP